MRSASEVAAELAAGERVRIVGGATKLGWGRPVDGLRMLSTRDLDRIVDHAPGDFTAVVQAGVRLADLQAALAPHGQRLALDPPGDGATIGGVVATADSGPLRHRYGAPRDLVIGVTLALPDGTAARAGGRVIKNVAGYDLGKLAAGSFGTLGVIAEVAVRLHPVAETATAVFSGDDPDRLGAIALDLLARPLELESLDVRWADGEGAILARFAGAVAGDSAASLGGETVTDDDEIWAQQRARQRSGEQTVVRVSALAAELPRVLRAAQAADASVVGRAGVGTFWLTLNHPLKGARPLLEGSLAPWPCVITDAPAELRAAVDPWDVPEGPELELMRRVKERFDPAGVCNPGIFVGGI